MRAFQVFSVLRQGSAILIAVLLAKSPLGTGGIGAYEMLLYIGFTLTAFWIAGLMQGFLSHYPRLDAGQQPAFLFNAYLLMLGLSALVLVLMWVGKKPLLLALAGQPDLPCFELFILFLCLNAPTFMVEHIYLLLNRPAAIFRFGFWAFGLQVAATLAPVYLGYGLEGAFFALIVLAAGKHLWLLYLLGQFGSVRWKPEQVRKWAVLSIPLILYALMGAFHQSFDNWLVSFRFDGDENMFAVFRYGARELPFSLALANAFGSAVLPDVASNLNSALPAIRQKSLKLFHLLFPLSILMMLSSRWLFPLVFNPDFLDSALLFNIFLLVTISRLVFSRPILVGLNANKPVFYISLVEMAFHVVLGFALSQYWGLAGIAIATVASHSLEKVLLCWYLHRKFGVRLSQYTDMRWFLGYSLAMAASFVAALAGF